MKAKLEIAGGGYGKVRLPFPRPVTERKQIKEVIVSLFHLITSIYLSCNRRIPRQVEMTKASSS